MAGNGQYIALKSKTYIAVPQGPPEATVLAAANDAGGAKDVVQFIESVTVVKSDAGKLEVGIMRMGHCKGSCTCTWRTEEGSAAAGKQFLHASGSITMKDGQNSASVTVSIIRDPNWNATKEFRIVLENPKDCTLGLYLKVVRVKIIDANVFPSNDFKGMRLEDMNEFALFASFLRLMWFQDGVPWRTFVKVIIGLLRNMYEYLHLTLGVYMVDKVFNHKHDPTELFIPGQRLLTAYVVAFALFVPRVIFFLLEHVEKTMDLNGRIRSEMSKSLFRKFMNYSTGSREETPLSDMVTCLTQDVDSVSEGYVNTLQMIRSVGQIAIAIFFTLQKNPGVWWAVMATPCIVAFWAKLRIRVFIEASEKVDRKESALLAFSNLSLAKMTVIAAYRQRPQMNELFADKASSLREEKIVSNKVNLNNACVPELMGPTLVAVYTLIGADLVLSEELGLGTYLATISVFTSICNNFGELFGVAMEIIATFPILKGLTDMLNKETELPDMQTAAKKTAEATKKKRAAMPDGDIPRVDRMEIEVRNVDFWFGKDEKLSKKLFRFKNLNFAAPQGKIIALKSASGAGRKTLLDLLAGVLYPKNSDGAIFIPSHLRTLLLSREIYILDTLSIWENLTFGNKHGNNPHRVEAILKYFRMDIVLEDKQFQKDLQNRKATFSGDGVVEAEEEGEDESVAIRNPISRYREADQALIHLIRGFVMNAEVMLFHRPFVHFHDEGIGTSLEHAMAEQRDNRGFKMAKETLMTRRPRTLFMSTDVPEHERIADLIWEMPKEVGAECRSFARDGSMATAPPASAMSYDGASPLGSATEPSSLDTETTMFQSCLGFSRA